MNPWRNAGHELDDAKHRAVIQGRPDLPRPPVFVACVVHGKTFRGPDHASRTPRAAGRRILRYLIDFDDRTPIGVMSGDYPS
jgi:hypothetical protein